jgi:Membrane protein involved in the export of O-antigen and teichoic acid
MVTSLLFNTAGISFRVYMSNKIGTEGIGLLQLIFSVYMMALLFVVTGINVAVTRLIAEEGGRVSFPVSKALIVRAITVSFLFSIPAFLFLFFGSDYMGSVWLEDERTIFPLKLLAVGMPFAGVSACFKGYFYAVGKITRSASSQAVELTIQILITAYILDYFMAGGPEYSCAAVALGITVAELASCMYVLTLFRFEQKSSDGRISEIFFQKRIMKMLLYISFPVSISALVRSGLRMMENLMIPIGFEQYGYTRKLALEKYGKIHGMVMPILMFPSSVILAFSVLLIPEISEANSLNHKKRVRYSVNRSLQLTSILSILTAGIFAAFSEKLGLAIYNSAECGALMKYMAPLIPLIYLDIVVDELLKGLNLQVSSLKYNMLDAVIKIVLIYYVLPLRGLPGLIFVLYVSNSVNILFSMRKLLKATNLKLKVKDWILKPVLSAAASGYMVIFLMELAGAAHLSNIIYLIIGIVSATIFYFFFLIRLGCITGSDLKWVKSVIQCTLPGKI